MIVIPRRAAAVAAAAAPPPPKRPREPLPQSQVRYPLACVRVREFADQYWVEATDGHVACVMRGPIPQSDIPPPELGGEPAREYLVPVADWKAAWKGDDDALVFASDGKEVLIAGKKGVARCEALEGSYPDIARCQPRGLLAAVLDPALLKKVGALSGEWAGEADFDGLRLVVASAQAPLAFHARSGAHTCEGLLMPKEAAGPDLVGYEPGKQPSCRQEEAPPPRPRPGPGMNGRAPRRKKGEK